MRLLRRNMRKLTVEETTNPRKVIVDGLWTGENEYDYVDVSIRGSYVPATGHLIEEIFGKVNDSKYILYSLHMLGQDSKVKLVEFGEEVTFKVTYRKEYLNHFVYGLTAYEQ